MYVHVSRWSCCKGHIATFCTSQTAVALVHVLTWRKFIIVSKWTSSGRTTNAILDRSARAGNAGGDGIKQQLVGRCVKITSFWFWVQTRCIDWGLHTKIEINSSGITLWLRSYCHFAISSTPILASSRGSAILGVRFRIAAQCLVRSCRCTWITRARNGLGICFKHTTKGAYLSYRWNRVGSQRATFRRRKTTT